MIFGNESSLILAPGGDCGALRVGH